VAVWRAYRVLVLEGLELLGGGLALLL